MGAVLERAVDLAARAPGPVALGVLTVAGIVLAMKRIFAPPPDDIQERDDQFNTATAAANLPDPPSVTVPHTPKNSLYAATAATAATATTALRTTTTTTAAATTTTTITTMAVANAPAATAAAASSSSSSSSSSSTTTTTTAAAAAAAATAAAAAAASVAEMSSTATAIKFTADTSDKEAETNTEVAARGDANSIETHVKSASVSTSTGTATDLTAASQSAALDDSITCAMVTTTCATADSFPNASTAGPPNGVMVAEGPDTDDFSPVDLSASVPRHDGVIMVGEDCDSLSRAIAAERYNDKEVESQITLDSAKFYNFGVVGAVNSGKSSLINAFMGFPAGQGPAKTDHLECTMIASEYTLPQFPHIKLWDLPGAGTRKVPARNYFKMFQLRRFDALIVVCSETISECDLEIFTWAAYHSIPCFYVRSKFDQTLRNVHDEHPTKDFQSAANFEAERLRKNVIDEICAFKTSPHRSVPLVSIPKKVYVVHRNAIASIMAKATIKAAATATVKATANKAGVMIKAFLKDTFIEHVGTLLHNFGIVEIAGKDSRANTDPFGQVTMDEVSLLTDLIVTATTARYQGLNNLDEVEEELALIQQELLACPKEEQRKEEEESNKPVADSEFFCPLDRNRTELMVDPVIATDGVTYERARIMNWLETNDQSPVEQGQTLERDVIPNKKLKAKIAQYKQDLDTWEKEQLAKRG